MVARKKLQYLILVFLLLIITAYFSLAGNSHVIIQPLAFNHQLHVVDQDLLCEDCHVQVKSHPKASLPSLEICADCHSDAMTESAAENKLLQFVNEEIEIPWKRIYTVDDHVYFSHRRHVTLGNVSCESCHGNVSELTVPAGEPLVEISMDKCMECHEEHQVDNDCLACHR